MQLQWLVGPAVGSVIGYITNDIAVRMLFRPHKEIRVFGKRLPFTPGLIPKERPRLARAIRDVLDQELLSKAVLEAALLSDTMLEKIDRTAETALVSIQNEERTPRMLLEGAFGAEAFGTFEAQSKRAVNIFLMEKILESGIERTAAEVVVAEAKSRVKGSAAAVLTIFWDDKRSASMEEKLAQTIREMLATHAPDAIDGMMESMLRDGLDTPIGVLTQKYGDRMEDLRAFVVKQYQAMVQKGLTHALKVLDLGQIVEDKLNSLDMRELETLIMTVMKKELRAIVWLGALLGAIMGIVNSLLMG